MSKKGSEIPDNSPAMIAMSQQAAMTQMHTSDNQWMLGMSQIGANIMQSQGMFMLGNSQIQATVEMAEGRNDARLEIARMNYDLAGRAEEDEHIEKMEELDVRRDEIAAEAQQTTETSDFLV